MGELLGKVVGPRGRQWRAVQLWLDSPSCFLVLVAVERCRLSSARTVVRVGHSLIKIRNGELQLDLA